MDEKLFRNVRWNHKTFKSKVRIFLVRNLGKSLPHGLFLPPPPPPRLPSLHLSIHLDLYVFISTCTLFSSHANEELFTFFPADFQPCSSEAETVLQAGESVSIQSPNYPEPYPDNHQCGWIIRVRKDVKTNEKTNEKKKQVKKM